MSIKKLLLLVLEVLAIGIAAFIILKLTGVW